jgi:hypothetical protein
LNGKEDIGSQSPLRFGAVASFSAGKQVAVRGGGRRRVLLVEIL